MEAIRKAGLRLIFEHGYAAMSLRQLAAEVGIQSGSLYNHISTKQELLFDLVRDHINELLAPARSRPAGQTATGRQAPCLHRLPRHLSHDPEARGLHRQFRTAKPGAEELREIVALRGAYERQLAEISHEGVAEGEFEVVDIQVATFAILALLTGLTTWYRPGGRLTRRPSSPPMKSWCYRVSPPARHQGPSQTRALPDVAAPGGAPMRRPKETADGTPAPRRYRPEDTWPSCSGMDVSATANWLSGSAFRGLRAGGGSARCASAAMSALSGPRSTKRCLATRSFPLS